MDRGGNGRAAVWARVVMGVSAALLLAAEGCVTVVPRGLPGPPVRTDVPSSLAVPSQVAPIGPGHTPLAVVYGDLTPDTLPFWVGQEAGIFSAVGLDVTDQRMGTVAAVSTVLGGQAQVAIVDGAEALHANLGGADLVIVATLTPIYDYVIEASSDIPDAASLSGHTVGLTARGTSAEIGLGLSLRALGLNAERDVHVAVIGPKLDLSGSLLGGSVDALLLRPPETDAVQARGLHPLLDQVDQPRPAAVECVVVTRALLDKQRDVVQRFADGLVQSIQREHDDRGIAMKALKAHLPDGDDRALERAYQTYTGRITAAVPTPSTEQLRDAQQLFARTDPQASAYDLSRMVDATLVRPVSFH